MRKLNPLLRLAAISGVETAVKLHIRRGDDLDARDGGGATPLILAAARRKKGVVRLLLDAGANPTLIDSDGRDALARASAAGCPETVALLTEALARVAVAESEESDSAELETNGAAAEIAPEDMPKTPTSPEAEEEPRAEDGPPAEHPAASPTALTPFLEQGGTVGTPTVEIARVEKLEHDAPVLDDDPLDADFEDGWEAEVESVAPGGDEAVAEAARQVHETIGRHRAVDGDEDWGDVDLYLPTRAAPLERDEGDGAIHALLLRALREGMVSEDELAEVCSSADGTRNEEAERLLGVVVGELGASVVEWTGAGEALVGEASSDEERLLGEATEFAKELASGRNDPFRYYSKDIRGELLDAEEEVALGREMVEAGRDALAALARWPEGLAALFDAADRVEHGVANAESFSTGPEPSADEEATSRGEASDEDGEAETELDGEAAAFAAAVAAVRAAGRNIKRVVEALESTRLTRGFLADLAERASKDNAGEDFAKAVRRQSVARERMTLCNLRLALSIARKYLRSGVPFDDLVQEANIGLMKAVERYDWRRGFRFSTYATWWIRQQVTRSIADTARVVRAPVHIQETARKILREREGAEARLGRPERAVETARRIGMSLAKTGLLLSMFEEAASLDETNPETGLSGTDLLVAPEAAAPAELAERASLRSTLMGMLDELDERAREVIVLRFGLGDEDAMTLEEVGRHFDVTRERIRQIEAKTMRKLSHEKRRTILAPFMGEAHCRRPSSASTESAPLEPPSAAEREATAFARPPARPVSARGLSHEETRPHVEASPLTTLPTGDLVSRLIDEALRLGLEVDDRRSQGGEAKIVAPFDSPPTIRAFGRRLLASGFRKVQRDVFAK